jgi:hypothetical protein
MIHKMYNDSVNRYNISEDQYTCQKVGQIVKALKRFCKAFNVSLYCYNDSFYSFLNRYNVIYNSDRGYSQKLKIHNTETL